jgi:hypothetical protein
MTQIANSAILPLKVQAGSTAKSAEMTQTANR